MSRVRGRKGLRRTREDWRGAEDAEDEEDTSPGRTGEGEDFLESCRTKRTLR